jgi:hypothetical protein
VSSRDDESGRELIATPESKGESKNSITKDEEPPVVARMVIEIRSDGTRTIARGAAEDASTGEKVAIEVAGSTPLQLALSLMKTMATVPALARSAAKALRLPKKKD